jgi:hypothetical protein
MGGFGGDAAGTWRMRSRRSGDFGLVAPPLSWTHAPHPRRHHATAIPRGGSRALSLASYPALTMALPRDRPDRSTAPTTLATRSRRERSHRASVAHRLGRAPRHVQRRSGDRRPRRRHRRGRLGVGADDDRPEPVAAADARRTAARAHAIVSVQIFTAPTSGHGARPSSSTTCALSWRPRCSRPAPSGSGPRPRRARRASPTARGSCGS